MPESTIHFDWGEYHEDIDYTCPWCHGEETLDFETWLDEEQSIKNEETGEYETKTNRERYGDGDEAEEVYSADEDARRCEHCTNGYLEPIMNYAYPVECSVDEDNRKIAADHGLFLFENPHDEYNVYMSLMGCGMDLSPNILAAYLDLTGWIPADWALEFQQNYRAYLSEEKHREIAAACLESLKNAAAQYNDKIKAVRFFIEEPDKLKAAEAEREARFNATLDSARDLDDPMLRGVVGLAALSQATGDIVPDDESANG